LNQRLSHSGIGDKDVLYGTSKRKICRQECYLKRLNSHRYLMADQWQCAVSRTLLGSSLLLDRTLHTSLEMQLDPATEHLTQK
jgi:hypothetical protein